MCRQPDVPDDSSRVQYYDQHSPVPICLINHTGSAATRRPHCRPNTYLKSPGIKSSQSILNIFVLIEMVHLRTPSSPPYCPINRIITTFESDGTEVNCENRNCCLSPISLSLLVFIQLSDKAKKPMDRFEI
jgi:hypothetical protein